MTTVAANCVSSFTKLRTRCCELCEQPTHIAHRVSPKGTSSLRSGRATTIVAHRVRDYKTNRGQLATTSVYSTVAANCVSSFTKLRTRCCELREQLYIVAHRVSPKGTSSLRSGRATTIVAHRVSPKRTSSLRSGRATTVAANYVSSTI